ncbi:MAG: glutamine amidotransferase [Gammaproteobacteria bacterium]|jgi:glutamine amidotransferase
MCRLAAYIGPDLFLNRLLEENPNSLVKQSWASEELRGTTLNADGFGFGWHLEDGNAAIYTSILPIWSDTNLTGLGQTLHSPHWLAYVRSATPGQAVNQANTQPFKHDKFLFLHNGRIENFNTGPRTSLHRHLSAEIASEIEGNTDSEYLFALFKQHLSSGCSIQEAIIGACEDIEVMMSDTPALLNLLISDGDSIYACRHAINGGHCPSLYYTESHPHFPDAVVIASEPFSLAAHWQAIKEHSLLRINPQREIEKDFL